MQTFIRHMSIILRYGKMYLDPRFAGLNVGSSQRFFVKMICEQPGITQDKLQPLVLLDKSNITRALDKLEKDGFITKKRYLRDKRTAHLYPTEKANAIYPKVVAIEEEWFEILLGDFTPEEKARFEALLQKAADGAMKAVGVDEAQEKKADGL